MCQQIWPDTFVNESNLAGLINELRSALGDTARKPRFIRTVHGFGYSFCGALDTGAPQAAAVVVFRGRESPLYEGGNVLGRDPSADVQIDDVTVSRRHALITIADGATLQDLESKNGTFVDGVRLAAPTSLVDGQTFVLGDASIVLRRSLLGSTVTLSRARRGEARSSSDAPFGGAEWNRLWEIFHAARGADPATREKILDQKCGSDRRLRSEVEALLRADDVPDKALDRRPFVAPGTMEAGAAVTPGVLLCDRFEIIRLIGQGGMGAVYEAVDRSLGARVALKALLAGIADERARKRFYREIDLARQVTHPNVCRLFDLFEHRQDDSGHAIAFVTMELLEGEKLAERMRREKLSTHEALEIARQIAAALTAAHARGIVHRDLKPANIVITRGDGNPRVVMTDFGLARRPDAETDGSHLTRSGQLFGTPAYMAPEQLLGREISPATDVYAFGLLLYEMITGLLPFPSDSSISRR